MRLLGLTHHLSYLHDIPIQIHFQPLCLQQLAGEGEERLAMSASSLYSAIVRAGFVFVSEKGFDDGEGCVCYS